MKDKGNKKICELLKEKNSGVIEDGIAMLQKALQLRPDYDDAMAYLNLIYRERGDLQCDDPAARASDLKIGRRVGRQDHGHQEGQGRKAAHQPGHHHAQPVGMLHFF